MEVVVTTGAISCAKLQSKHHNQQTNIQFLQAGCPSCRPTNSVKALRGNDLTRSGFVLYLSMLELYCCLLGPLFMYY